MPLSWDGPSNHYTNGKLGIQTLWVSILSPTLGFKLVVLTLLGGKPQELHIVRWVSSLSYLRTE